MPGFSNSLIISFLVHLLVIIPTLTVLMHPPGKIKLPDRETLRITVNRTPAAKSASAQSFQPSPPVAVAPSIPKLPPKQLPMTQPKAKPIQVAAKPSHPRLPKVVKKPPQKKVEQKPQPVKVAKTEDLVPRKPTPSVKVAVQTSPPPVTPANAAPDITVRTKQEEVTSKGTPQSTRSEEDFRLLVARAIARMKHYPRRARMRGQEGTVTVAFTLLRNGQIIETEVTDSSTFPSLDRAALTTLAGIDGELPIPSEFHRERWHFRIPINFRLN